MRRQRARREVGQPNLHPNPTCPGQHKMLQPLVFLLLLLFLLLLRRLKFVRVLLLFLVILLLLFLVMLLQPPQPRLVSLSLPPLPSHHHFCCLPCLFSFERCRRREVVREAREVVLGGVLRAERQKPWYCARALTVHCHP